MRFSLTIVAIVSLLYSIGCRGQPGKMKLIKGGTYAPLFGVDSVAVRVSDFYLDIYPVTNEAFQKFVQRYPKWRKSNVIALFADESYLGNWQSDTVVGNRVNKNTPATLVSWYAAKAYCKVQGKRLPTMDEWEYVAMANETSKNAQRDSIFNLKILGGYEKAKTYNNPIGSTFKNYWGIYDMHGLVWEWTSDFNSVLLSGESRKDVDKDRQLFCAGGSVGTTDLMNYAAFMRYAFRSSVKANYCIQNLGFRCAKDIEK